jgi:hypothetical protein
MEQVSMMLLMRSGDRTPSPLTLRDLDRRFLGARYSERLGKELARHPARVPEVTAWDPAMAEHTVVGRVGGA